MLERVRKVYSKVVRVALLLCMLSVAVMMGYGFVDVFGRYLFNRPLQGTYELSELLMVAVVFLSLAGCQAEDRHMRVDFFIAKINKRLRPAVDSVAYICGIVVTGVLSWYSIPSFWHSWNIREVTMGIVSFPIYPAKFMVVVGSGLLMVQLLLDLLRTIKERAD